MVCSSASLALDLSPSMHWPTPITTQSIADDRGPVEYRIRPQDREEFLEALAKLEPARRRDGAYVRGISRANA
jgi:hypothetical protein